MYRIIPAGAVPGKVMALFVAAGVTVGGGAGYALTRPSSPSTPSSGFVVDPIFAQSPEPGVNAEPDVVEDEVTREGTVEQAPSVQRVPGTVVSEADDSQPHSQYNPCADPNNAAYYTASCGHVSTDQGGGTDEYGGGTHDDGGDTYDDGGDAHDEGGDTADYGGGADEGGDTGDGEEGP